MDRRSWLPRCLTSVCLVCGCVVRRTKLRGERAEHSQGRNGSGRLLPAPCLRGEEGVGGCFLPQQKQAC